MDSCKMIDAQQAKTVSSFKNAKLKFLKKECGYLVRQNL